MTVDVENLSPKAIEILDVTRALIQTRGYNGFSFRDVAKEVGVKSASVHYHFPTKIDMATAAARLVRIEYADFLNAILAETDNTHDALHAYAKLFSQTLADKDRICLCAMLASDADALPKEVKAEVNAFFEEQISWLKDRVELGIKNKEVKPDVNPEGFAMSFLFALEGGMIVLRNMGKPDELEAAAKNLIDLIGS